MNFRRAWRCCLLLAVGLVAGCGGTTRGVQIASLSDDSDDASDSDDGLEGPDVPVESRQSSCYPAPLTNVLPPLVRPPVTPDSPPGPPTSELSIVVPISVPLGGVLGAAESSVPAEWDTGSAWSTDGDWQFQYSVQRSPLETISPTDSAQFAFASTLTYSLRARNSRMAPGVLVLTCGGGRRVRVAFDVSVGWMSDWSLALTGFSRRAPEHQVPCDVHLENEGWLTFGCIVLVGAAAPFCAFIPTLPRAFNDEARGRLDRMIGQRLDAAADAARAEIGERTSVRGRMASLWARMGRPRTMSYGDQTTWILARPRQVSASRPTVVGDRIATDIRLFADIEWHSAEPNAGGATPLPELDTTPETGTASGIRASHLVAWSAISRGARSVLRNTRFPATGQPYTCVRDARVAPEGRSMAVVLTVEGTVSGQIALLADPVYDGTHRALRLENLRLREDSAAALDRIPAAAGVSEIIMALGEGLVWPLGSDLDALGTSLNAHMAQWSSDDLAIEGQWATPQVQSVLVTAPGVWASLSIGGNVVGRVRG